MNPTTTQDVFRENWVFESDYHFAKARDSVTELTQGAAMLQRLQVARDTRTLAQLVAMGTSLGVSRQALRPYGCQHPANTLAPKEPNTDG